MTCAVVDQPLNEPTTATDFAAGTDTENRTPPDTGVGASGTCLTAQATSQLMPTTLARIRITLRIVRRVPKHQE
jgi:hypothetical protein